MTSESHAPAATRTSPLLIAAGVAAAIVVSVLADAVIALIAHAIGASDEFPPLQFGGFTFFTVIGVLAGLAGWAVIRSRSRRPAAVLRWLVPTVVAVSLVPDLLLLPGDTFPGTSVLAVVSLMVMHVVVAAIAVTAFRRVLPLPDRA